jgi:hypothetical protein
MTVVRVLVVSFFLSSSTVISAADRVKQKLYAGDKSPKMVSRPSKACMRMKNKDKWKALVDAPHESPVAFPPCCLVVSTARFHRIDHSLTDPAVRRVYGKNVTTEDRTS